MKSLRGNQIARIFPFAFLVSALAQSACRSDPPSASGSEPPAFAVSDETNTDGVATFAFYLVRPDFRDCLYPLCGGAFVKAVNRHYTICSDGSLQNECYVAVENYDGLGLDPETLGRFRTALYSNRAIVRGAIIPHEFPTFGDLGELVATEGWRTATDAPPVGTFWRLRGPEFECITYPCYNIRVARLNSGAVVFASDAFFEGVPGIDPDLIDLAYRLMRAGNLIATGEIAIPEGEGIFFDASQLYFRLAP